MAGNSFGQLFRITTAGESHGTAKIVIIDGMPSGIKLSEKDIQPDLDRRKPGQSKITTQRKESDTAEILSGVFVGKTTGTSISVLIRNKDQRTSDYKDIKNKYRPGHADYTFDAKYGFRDYRGGGRASGRETVSRVIGGAIAEKILPPDFAFLNTGSPRPEGTPPIRISARPPRESPVCIHERSSVCMALSVS